MNKVKLEDLCDAIVDCPHSTPKWTDSGFLVIRNFNLNNTVLTGEDPYYVSEDTYLERTRRAIPEPGDIIISREAPIGRVGMVSQGMKCCLGQRLVLLKPNRTKINPRYLLMVLTSDYVRIQYERADTSGSIVSNLSLPQLRSLEIPVIDGADEAAKLIATLEDKIALNKRMMAELEETARLIYDYWFVQFDFPDENGNPYRSSGGKMIYRETLKREIPVGWRAGTVGDLTEYGEALIDNVRLTADTYVSTDNILPNRGGIIRSQYLPNSGSSRRFEKWDILLSNIRPYFKKIWLADRVGGCCNDVLIIHSLNQNDWAYLYFTFESDAFFAYDSAGAKGSKMPRGDKEHIMRFPVALASSRLRDEFACYVESFFAARSELQSEISELMRLRDWLLPMLMNGQVVIHG